MKPTALSGIALGLDNQGYLDFGLNVAGRETNAGKMGYALLTANTLDLVGAGTVAGSRNVKISDNLTVASAATVSGAFRNSGGIVVTAGGLDL